MIENELSVLIYHIEHIAVVKHLNYVFYVDYVVKLLPQKSSTPWLSNFATTLIKVKA